MADTSSKLRLRITAPDGKSRTVELTGSSFIVGRGEEATLRLDDPKVADLHVRLKLRGGELFATDLGADGGSTIDGQTIGKETVLKAGQSLKLGDSQLALASEKAKFEKGTAGKSGGIAKSGNKASAAAPVVSASTDGNAARVLEPETEREDEAPEAATVVEWSPAKSDSKKKEARVAIPIHEQDVAAGRLQRGTKGALSEYAARFLSEELPDAFKPTKDSRRLQVALVWGNNQFLDIKDLAPGSMLSAGSAPGASLRIYHEALKASTPLIQSQPNGEFRVLLPAAAQAKVRADGQTVTADKLLASGRASAIEVPFKGASYEIGLNDRVNIEFGNLQVIARYTRPQPTKKRPLAERTDVNFLSTVAILLLMAVAFERMIAITDFGDSSLSDDLFKNKDRFAKYIAKAEQKEKPKFEKLSGVKEGAKAKEDEGKFGKKEADKKEAAPSKKGAPVVDVNKREEDRKKVMNSGLLALLGDSAGATSNVFGPGGLGTGLNNALGGINGAGAMGDAAGVGGLGSRGGGSGGGGTGLGIGGLGGKGSGRGRGGSGEFDLGGTGKATTQFVPGKTTVMGGLTADEVGRIIRRHWNEIKYCYEKELSKDPNLYGKVGVYFEIGPVGDVTIAQVRETTMNNGEVESCMLSKVKLWKFPSPRGGGVVQVNYPFIFKQG